MTLARNRTRLLAALGQFTLFLMAVAVAAGQTKPAVVEESDRRLPPANEQWGFHEAVNPDPRLPRVLLIGDSIVGAYHDTVIAGLKGTATIDFWTTGLHELSPELHDLLKAAVTHAPYAVVHFNIGLHGWQEGRVPDREYEAAMRKYVAIVRAGAPHAQLIWASITPVTVKGSPEKLDPDINAIIVRRNAAAARIMAENHIEIDDLYGLMSGRLALGRGDQFHWTEPAVRMQGDAVTAIILKNLPAPASVH
jgi:hypothetical protein